MFRNLQANFVLLGREGRFRVLACAAIIKLPFGIINVGLLLVGPLFISGVLIAA